MIAGIAGTKSDPMGGGDCILVLDEYWSMVLRRSWTYEDSSVCPVAAYRYLASV